MMYFHEVSQAFYAEENINSLIKKDEVERLYEKAREMYLAELEQMSSKDS